MPPEPRCSREEIQVVRRLVVADLTCAGRWENEVDRDPGAFEEQNLCSRAIQVGVREFNDRDG